MLLFDRQTNPGVIAVIVGIMGVGIGFTFQPTLVAFQAHCTKAQRAVVISDRNYFRCLGGACGLAVSAAILQATLRSNLPDGYKQLAHSTYSLPSKSSIPDTDWESILTAYTKASRGVFILQVPLIGVCFLACTLIRDRGLERPGEKEENEAAQRRQNAWKPDDEGHSEHPIKTEAPGETQVFEQSTENNASREGEPSSHGKG